MTFKAVVSNKSYPEYGVSAIPFPIPSDQYDHTFCCQQTTVIADFSDLERVGNAYSLIINGGTMA